MNSRDPENNCTFLLKQRVRDRATITELENEIREVRAQAQAGETRLQKYRRKEVAQNKEMIAQNNTHIALKEEVMAVNKELRDITDDNERLKQQLSLRERQLDNYPEPSRRQIRRSSSSSSTGKFNEEVKAKEEINDEVKVKEGVNEEVQVTEEQEVHEEVTKVKRTRKPAKKKAKKEVEPVEGGVEPVEVKMDLGLGEVLFRCPCGFEVRKYKKPNKYDYFGPRRGDGNHGQAWRHLNPNCAPILQRRPKNRFDTHQSRCDVAKAGRPPAPPAPPAAAPPPARPAKSHVRWW
jgi:hypothetical protein